MRVIHTHDYPFFAIMGEYMKERFGSKLVVFSSVLAASVFALAGVLFVQPYVFYDLNSASAVAGGAPTASSTVIVSNAAPTVSNVVLNNATSIVLTANATTVIRVTADITDNNGCSEITDATATIMLYRANITSSTCRTSANNQNCYVLTQYTATSSCSASVTVLTTSTFGVYYFAQATDASSSNSGTNWIATVIARDTGNTTGTADSGTSELLTLTALDVTTSSLNYGTLAASSTTGSTNQNATSTNAGNSSTTLQLSANSTLTSGSNSIPTSSQRYSTSSFTFQGTSTALTASPATVSGFLLTVPTSTTNVARTTFWGLIIPAGTATGTYNGVNLFTSLFQE